MFYHLHNGVVQLIAIQSDCHLLSLSDGLLVCYLSLFEQIVETTRPIHVTNWPSFKLDSVGL